MKRLSRRGWGSERARCRPSARAPVPQSSTIRAPASRLDVPPAFAQTGPVKIGVLAAKAGVTAPVGESGLRGTQFAVDRINAAGGILGRRIELVVEEESNPKDTVERFRKLGLQSKADVITGGISTAVGLAVGPVSEELKALWLARDATTQKGIDESMPKVKYSFR